MLLRIGMGQNIPTDISDSETMGSLLNAMKRLVLTEWDTFQCHARQIFEDFEIHASARFPSLSHVTFCLAWQ